MVLRGLIMAALILPAPLAGATPPAIDWLISQTARPLDLRKVGSYTPNGPLIGVDPLTYVADYKWPYADVPAGPATFYALIDREDGRVSKAVLVFSGTAPTCGADLATIPVDTGTGAFLDRDTAAELDALGAKLADQGKDLYNDFLMEKMGDSSDYADFITLPQGHRFPIFGTGWGDGRYPVASLTDGAGQVIALYADFMGADEKGTWLLPPPCTTS